MEQFEELVTKIELAVSLGEEPTQEELAAHGLNNDEYIELITLSSMIENDIELIRSYTNGNTAINTIELLNRNYNNGYFPLLQKFGLAEFLPNI